MDAGSHPPAWSRWLRRIFRPFLSPSEKARILAAVEEQERRTTGQISVHVMARATPHDVLALAARQFALLKLDRTAERNGVLILITHLDHQFGIWGDVGIHVKAGGEWARATEALATNFAARRYADGVVSAVREVGDALAREFPRPSR